MSATAAVARDLLREAIARKWVLGLLLAITLVLATIGLGLELDVVDGVLAATRLFGDSLGTHLRAVDVALRPLFEGASWLVFYGGIGFGILACADFAPTLLAPGRIEHLLALPVRRAELVAGTFLGVEALILAAALYGSGGLVLILWAKTGVFGLAPLVSALLATAGFAAVYAVMTLAALLARSAALAGAAGAAAYVLMILAGNRAAVAPVFEAGASRGTFLLLTAPLPRLPELARAAVAVANGLAPDPSTLAVQLGGTALFTLGILALAVAVFERKDF